MFKQNYRLSCFQIAPSGEFVTKGHDNICLYLFSKTETSCDDAEGPDPPKVMKIFNRSLLFECVSRGDPEALEGLLEYLQSQEKRLTDEDFRGEIQM